MQAKKVTIGELGTLFKAKDDEKSRIQGRGACGLPFGI